MSKVAVIYFKNIYMLIMPPDLTYSYRSNEAYPRASPLTASPREYLHKK